MSTILPLAQWPQADAAMWQALFAARGPLDDSGGLAHVRATTRESLRPRYGRWLRWLSLTDPAALSTPPVERVTIERLRAWVGDLAHTRPMSRLAFVDGVLRVVSAHAPGHDWSAQNRLRTRLRKAAGTGDRSRKAGRVVSSAVLLEAGLRLAGPMAEAAATPQERRMRLRDGTMIALLALLPMRVRAFASLELGRSVLVHADRIDIALPETATKSGQPWEASVPAVVEPVLRRYLRDARPHLLARGGRSHAMLWSGKKGEVLDQSHISSRLGHLTKALLGVRVSAHLFRDAAATTLARTSPEAARLIRPILAHTSFGTAERHYIHAQSIDAGRAYARIVQKVKEKTR